MLNLSTRTALERAASTAGREASIMVADAAPVAASRPGTEVQQVSSPPVVATYEAPELIAELRALAQRMAARPPPAAAELSLACAWTA